MLYPVQRLHILAYGEKIFMWIENMLDDRSRNPYKAPIKYSTEEIWK